jgi:hypothetical protein
MARLTRMPTVVLAVLVAASPAAAQPPAQALSLDEALSRALRTSKTVQIAAADVTLIRQQASRQLAYVRAKQLLDIPLDAPIQRTTTFAVPLFTGGRLNAAVDDARSWVIARTSRSLGTRERA